MITTVSWLSRWTKKKKQKLFSLWWELLAFINSLNFKVYHEAVLATFMPLQPSTYLSCNWKIVAFHYLSPVPPYTASSGSHKSELFSCELFCFFVLDSTHERAYNFYFLWLISLSIIMPSGSIHIVISGRISLFFIAV